MLEPEVLKRPALKVFGIAIDHDRIAILVRDLLELAGFWVLLHSLSLTEAFHCTGLAELGQADPYSRATFGRLFVLWREENIDTMTAYLVPIQPCPKNRVAAVGLVHELDGLIQHHLFGCRGDRQIGGKLDECMATDFRRALVHTCPFHVCGIGLRQAVLPQRIVDQRRYRITFGILSDAPTMPALIQSQFVVF